VAVCTPYPPDESGIADYNKRLLEALCARHPAEVHVVVRRDTAGYSAPALNQLSIISSRQFEWLAEHGYYDSIIYCMGNSPHHGYIFDLLKEHPGTVWMHDIRLTDFYRWYYSEHLRRDIHKLPEELVPWASRYPDHRGDVLLRDNVIQHQQGVYLAGEVASFAERLVVSSTFSRDLIKIESPSEVPASVIPHAALGRNGGPPPEDWPTLARRHGLNEGARPILSLGIVWPTKCPDTIIEAFAAIAPANRDVVLVFAGPCDDRNRLEMENKVASLGLRTRVLFTGYVEESELDAWLAASVCTIQLRYPTNGESSGAVMRALAAGVPTIVNDHGSFRELPDDAVLKVPALVEPSQLADAISRVCAGEELRRGLGTAALRYSEEVSMEAVADRVWSEVVCAR
jgi:glycosyltransferase involved in cell wall biosynthesis